MSYLKVNHLTKAFEFKMSRLTIFQDISLELHRGETLAVVGPSGSGKSTLLSILGTLEEPTSGDIILDGRAYSGLTRSERAAIRRDQIGFIFQEHCLLPQCTAYENLLIPVLADGKVTETESQRAIELLSAVGLASRTSHRPMELSGGERQRVAIARALMRHPTLLLADEPTGNLDPRTAATIAELLHEIARLENTMLIVVTHSSKISEKMDRIHVMNEYLATDGTSQSLKKEGEPA